MPNYIVLSNTNPIKFYRQSEAFGLDATALTAANLPTFNPSYHTRTIDEDFYFRNLPKWMNKIKYFQPFEQGDTIVLSWEGVIEFVSGVNPFTLNVLNGNGGIVKTITPTTGTTLDATNRLYGVICPLYDLPEGTYFLQIKMTGYFTIADEYLISEPISVKLNHEGTVLIEYKNSTNDFGIYYEENILFQLRVHAQIKDITDTSTFNVYNNTEGDLQMLGGTKINDVTIEFGGNRNPFPLWLYEKLATIALHDYTMYDGYNYTRIEGGTLEKIPFKDTELVGAKLKARRQDSNTDLIVSDLQYKVLYTMPKGVVIFVDKIDSLSIGSYTINDFFTSREHFLARLNGDAGYLYKILNSDPKLYFAINYKSELIVQYSNEDSRIMFENAFVNMMIDNYIKLDVISDGTAGSEQVVFEPAESSGDPIPYFLFPGDGSSVIISDFVIYDSIGYAYDYGKFTMYAFFQNYESMTLSSSDSIITSMAARISPNSYDFNLENNSLQTLENNVFEGCTCGLSTLNLRGDKLTSTSIDRLIIWAYDSLVRKEIDSLLSINVQMQTPVTRPSGSDSGITKILILLKQGINDFIHD